MVNVVLVVVSIIFTVKLCSAQYSVPEVTFEAYEPKGFRAYIPDVAGLRLFTFNGKVNGIIANSEPGQINGEARSPTNGVWEFVDPELQLVIGDKISYWIFVQYERLGYRKDGLQWEVTELKKGGGFKCDSTPTVISGGGKACAGGIIFEDNFNGDSIDTNKWTIEQYIPTYAEPNYEFVSYQNIDACRFIRDSNLYLKPIAARSLSQLRGVLDLRDGCSRSRQSVACYYRSQAAYINPPVTSGKITSNISFKYGKVEVRAKLPAGDWIYPQIELIPKESEGLYTKLLIAYSRGNERLTSNSEDVGAVLLFGGPVLNDTEPARSSNLRSKRENTPFSSQFRTYSVSWTQDKMDVMIDNEIYGTISTTSSTFFPFNSEFRLTLGVGVGGIIDFPDGYLSGSFRKPWLNKEPKQVRNFFSEKAAWEGTWHDDNVALQIDYVKITAL